MIEQSVLDAYNEVTHAGDCVLKYIRRSQVTRFSSTEYSRLLESINAFDYTEGWVCFQSELHIVRHGETSGALPDNVGRVLSAELCSDKATLYIQQHNDGWFFGTVNELLESEVEAGHASENEQTEHVIAKLETFALATAAGKKNAQARYHVYLKTGMFGFKPWCSRFLGFGDQAGESL